MLPAPVSSCGSIGEVLPWLPSLQPRTLRRFLEPFHAARNQMPVAIGHCPLSTPGECT